ncbi:ABC transporter substrate-binding protein [Acuticoccus kandeliae]|uniref:ABC transporter substrate-binding protein n=1 Tax=Acuticoccus kandeliae TaxID=2073160 RepID=UPI000D3E1FFD|nr:ABC transporter substrate-binding protein [Acuticoccus kandeliae]
MILTRRNLVGVALVVGALFGSGSFVTEAVAQEKVLRLPLARTAGNLDPQRYVGMFAVQDMVFDPLVDYVRGGEIVPALAESWEVSEDGKTITFHLRPNVTFTDGTPWNAEAMTWNLERWMPKEDYNWLAVAANFDRLETIDDLTVAVHFKERVPTALTEFAYVRPVRFLSPKSVDKDGAYVAPVGTGPWKVASETAGSTELVPNENYWGEKIDLDRVVLTVLPDARSRLSALRAGEIDAIGGNFIAALSPQDALTLKSSGMTVVSDVGADTLVMGFNPNRPLFQDVKVREAFNLLIDRPAIAKVIMKDYATPTMNLYPDVVPNSGTRYEVPAKDVERAKALLEEAGWTGDGDTRTKDGQPLDIEMLISEDAVAGSREIGEVLQNMFAEAGIKMSLRNVDHAARHGEIPSMHYDVSLFITNGAPYDPFNTLVQMFDSTIQAGTDGKIYMSTELDPLIQAAVTASDAEQAAKFQAVYDWLHDNWAIAPIFHKSRIWAHGDNIRTFVVPPTEYEMPLTGLVVAD